MIHDVLKIIRESRKLCRDSWELRMRLKRQIVESQAICDQIREDIRFFQKQRKELRKKARNIEDS